MSKICPTNCWCKGSTTIFCIFSVHYQPGELEPCMGWKCTWCFVTMNVGFIFVYVHLLKAFWCIESIKSCLVPFLSNFFVPLLSGQPLLSGNFLKSRGWTLNRGRTVYASGLVAMNFSLSDSNPSWSLFCWWQIYQKNVSVYRLRIKKEMNILHHFLRGLFFN